MRLCWGTLEQEKNSPLHFQFLLCSIPNGSLASLQRSCRDTALPFPRHRVGVMPCQNTVTGLAGGTHIFILRDWLLVLQQLCPCQDVHHSGRPPRRGEGGGVWVGWWGTWWGNTHRWVCVWRLREGEWGQGWSLWNMQCLAWSGNLPRTWASISVWDFSRQYYSHSPVGLDSWVNS